MAGPFVAAGLIALLFIGYRASWTGFGPLEIEKTGTGERHPPRTLWDWMQLLIVSAVLAGVGLWFSGAQSEAQRGSAESIAKGQQKAEEQRAQDTALQSYIDQMSQLMSSGKLRDSQPESDERVLARTRTLTVLRRATEPERKRTVVRFLYEARLIRMEPPSEQQSVQSPPIVTLEGANLIEADLSGPNRLPYINLRGALLSRANLARVDLTHADLSEATMNGATLDGADLTGADLSGASLSRASLGRPKNEETGEEEGEATNLTRANLRDAKGITNEELEQQVKSLAGATMPDGTKHD